MKLTLLVNYDVPALLALHYLLPSCAAHEVSVFYTRKDVLPSAPLGLHRFAEFEAKILTENTNFKSFNDLVALELNDINGADFESFVATNPDLVVSIRHMTILQTPVIEVPKYGVINLHSGLLPAYQGVMSTFRAMLNKDEVLGTTLHFIEGANIDSGSIIAQSRTPACYAESYFWNVLNLYRNGCHTVLEAINLLSRGEDLQAKPQVGRANSYTYPSVVEIDSAVFPLFKLADVGFLDDYLRGQKLAGPWGLTTTL